jgi:hypothetical protein
LQGFGGFELEEEVALKGETPRGKEQRKFDEDVGVCGDLLNKSS